MIWVAITACPAFFAMGYLTGRFVMALQFYRILKYSQKDNQCFSNE